MDIEKEFIRSFHREPLVEIKRVPYSGPVYNFSVEHDESYVANNMVVHNCECITIPIQDELESMGDDDSDDALTP